MRTKGQALNEFLLVMAALVFIGGYLAFKLIGQQSSAVPVAEDNVTTKIANDMN
jgi:uncharacterized protein (UPF0333 family)